VAVTVPGLDSAYYQTNGFSNLAALPSSLSISRSLLYLASRSLLLAEPVFICPAKNALKYLKREEKVQANH
jgi:hypothetical protein